jgi:hypothetical protein
LRVQAESGAGGPEATPCSQRPRRQLDVIVMVDFLKSLQLAGDGDEVDLLNIVEHSFEVVFTDDEASACHTVGQLHDAILKKIDPNSLNGISFFRLRKTLRKTGKAGKITTRSELTDLFGKKIRKSAMRLIKEDARLQTRIAYLDSAAFAVSVAAILSAIVVGIWTKSWWPPIAGMIAVVFAMRFLAVDFPPGIKTLGDLAVRCGALNFGALVREGYSTRRSYVWPALTIVVADATGIDCKRIDQNTRFF